MDIKKNTFTIGHYTVTSTLLGRGNYGEVYLGHVTATGQPVAIKIIPINPPDRCHSWWSSSSSSSSSSSTPSPYSSPSSHRPSQRPEQQQFPTHLSPKPHLHACLAQSSFPTYPSPPQSSATHPSSTRLKKILEEVRLLRQLRGVPNVVQLLDAFFDDREQRVYQVFELIRGENLYAILLEDQERGVDESLVRPLFQDLARVVYACHCLHVVHLDLKLENVMYDFEAARLVLIDFGFAAQIDPRKPHACVSKRNGSPHYCCPEIYYGNGAYDGRAADVWSLGVLLFLLVAGEFPFDDIDRPIDHVDLEIVFAKKARGEYTFPSHFSVRLRDLLARCFAINPAERITLEQMLSHPWFETAPSALATMDPDVQHQAACGIVSVP